LRCVRCNRENGTYRKVRHMREGWKGGDLGLRDAIRTFGSHGQSDEQPLSELNLFASSVRTPMV